MTPLLFIHMAGYYVSILYVGRPVQVVNGAYRGLRAIMESINVSQFSATVKIDQVRLEIGNRK